METLLIVDGLPVDFCAHIERLERSVRAVFEAELPADARSLALDRAAGIGLGRLRLTVAPGPLGRLRAEAEIAAVDPGDVFPSWDRATALRSLTVHRGLGSHKWADRSGPAWARSDETRGSLPLILDGGEEVLEASRANVFVVEREALVTPPADGRILPGVARARAIEAAHRLGIELREESIALKRLKAAGQAFLTGSIRGIEPVKSVDETALATPGRAAQALVAQMRQAWGSLSAPDPQRPRPSGPAPSPKRRRRAK